jgi:hypothetical protein
MAGAPLIPEGVAGVAALVDAFIGLLALLGCAVCLGLLFAWRNTLGALIEAITGFLTIKVFGLHVNFGWPLTKVDNVVQAALSRGAHDLEVVAGRFFHALGVILGWMVNFMVATVNTMERAIGFLLHVHLPRYVKWAIRAAFPLAWLTKLVAQEVAKAIPFTKKYAHALVHDVEAELEKFARGIEADAAKSKKKLLAALAALAALGGAIALPRPHFTLPKAWRGLTKRLAKLERRMHRVEGLLAAGVLAAAMANVLGVTARCLRSGNVGKVARKLCGLSPRALEDLLGLIADVVILADICEVITILEDGLSLIDGPLNDWIATADAMFVHCNYDLPPATTVTLPTLAPVTGLTLSLPAV